MSNVKWFWLFQTRSNWIFWIIFLQFVFLGMAYIDYDMAIESVAYIVLLNIGLTCIFLFYFLREVKLYQHFIIIRKSKKLNIKNY